MLQHENISTALEELSKLQEALSGFKHALGLLSLDASTAAPSDSWEGRGKTTAFLSECLYKALAAPENALLFEYLDKQSSSLTPVTKRQLQVLQKEYDRVQKIPKQEYVDYQLLLNDAFPAWLRAKQASDFSMFLPFLEKIVSYNQRMAHLYDPDRDPYEVLAGLYEEGITVAGMDAFFEQLRNAIVPLLKKIQSAKQIDTSFMNCSWPVDKQKALSDYLMDLLKIDRRYCTLTESEHPFTENFNNKDVRITTHYYEEDPLSSMFSVIHEGGHALYELGCDDVYNYTCLSGGVSMGIHESQSRFYENLIGRSESFIHAIFPKLCSLFPENMHDISETALWKAANKAEASLIRTDADELTYSLHIIVRYQIEKELIHGTLSAQDVPSRWNALYKEYLGIDVPSDDVGCLQDVHWAGGSFGYFPSYALGSAYGAQFLAKMIEELGDIYSDIEHGDLTRINLWLHDHIHKYASFLTPKQILEESVGTFDPAFYIDYLTRKYTKLYEL